MIVFFPFGGFSDKKGVKFKKGQSGNPKGRPKKWVSTLTDSGYKIGEVRDCILAMMAMNIRVQKRKILTNFLINFLIFISFQSKILTYHKEGNY